MAVISEPLKSKTTGQWTIYFSRRLEARDGRLIGIVLSTSAVATLSGELGMATTAEGVETQEQLDALAVLGCTEVQGYLFSPAVPTSQVPDICCPDCPR